MKKGYEVPKAEKTEFDYTEAIVASSCIGGVTIKYTHQEYGCKDNTVEIVDPYLAN